MSPVAKAARLLVLAAWAVSAVCCASAGHTKTESAPSVARPAPTPRPVRFTKDPCGAILDAKTGLRWLVGPDEATDWNEAAAFARRATACGGGWRLPTIEELKNIRDPNHFAGRGYSFQGIVVEAHLDPIFAGIGGGTEVWTAQRDADGVSAWLVDTHIGDARKKPMVYEWRARAFAVR